MIITCIMIGRWRVGAKVEVIITTIVVQHVLKTDASGKFNQKVKVQRLQVYLLILIVFWSQKNFK